MADSSSRNAVSFSSARTTNRFRCRDARQQSTSFALRNPTLTRSPNSIRLCFQATGKIILPKTATYSDCVPVLQRRPKSETTNPNCGNDFTTLLLRE